MPRRSNKADASGAALDLGMPKGALQLPPPPVRKPSRGALGGAAPRGARTRLPPELAPAQRGGTKAKKTTARRKGSKK